MKTVNDQSGMTIKLGGEKYKYGGLTLVGAFDPSPADFDRRRLDNYGLPQVVSGMFAWVRDEEGHYYNVTRQIHGVMTPRLRVTVGQPGEGGEDAPETFDSFYGFVREEATADSCAMSGRRGSNSHARGFRLEFDSRMDSHWTESGILDVRCHRAGPAFEMHCPDRDLPWYWNCILNRVEGEILGRKVEGFGEIEMNFGRGWQDWLEHPLQGVEYWVYYLLQGPGGSTEYAAVALTEDAGFAIVIEDGDARGIYDIAYDASAGDDGLPDAVTWTHGKRSWKLNLETRRLSSQRNPGFLWQLGSVTRDDGMSGMAFLETRGSLEGHFILGEREP